MDQVIWNNKFLCVDKKSVYRRDIADQGFCKIWDLFSVDDEQLNPEQSFFHYECNYFHASSMAFVNSNS